MATALCGSVYPAPAPKGSAWFTDLLRQKIATARLWAGIAEGCLGSGADGGSLKWRLGPGGRRNI